jgi:hypothetical protein
MASRYKDVLDLYRAMEAVWPGRDSEAQTLPVPRTGDDGRFEVVVLVFRQPARLGQERMFPPHRLSVLDPTDAAVRRAAVCRPADFGVDAAPDAPIDGFGLGPVPPKEFTAANQRLAALSPRVWEIFADGGPVTDEDRGVVREYATHFARVTYQPLLPYYAAAAPRFFSWLATAAR